MKCKWGVEVTHEEERRSREGAWIEIMMIGGDTMEELSRSREGAWIEIRLAVIVIRLLSVAPARERGLKLNGRADDAEGMLSLPRGSVD